MPFIQFNVLFFSMNRKPFFSLWAFARKKRNTSVKNPRNAFAVSRSKNQFMPERFISGRDQPKSIVKRYDRPSMLAYGLLFTMPQSRPAPKLQNWLALGEKCSYKRNRDTSIPRTKSTFRILLASLNILHLSRKDSHRRPYPCLCLFP